MEKCIIWHDLRNIFIEGRGWGNPKDCYRRLPARAKSRVRKPVWSLSSNSAGMMARFITDSDEIKVKWKLKSVQLSMPHMPATGVSGIDLYVRHMGEWRWLGMGRPESRENESSLACSLTREKREYALYLPLYNGVSSVEIGISSGASFENAPVRTKAVKPVVFYGTSIVQGGCASRPGMAYPSIIGRHLDIPTINLGFSGNGMCESEVADLLAELDPEAYVIDCLPNMHQTQVDERIRYLLKTLKEKHPGAPVILVENVNDQRSFLAAERPTEVEIKNKILAEIYADEKPGWNGRLHYVKCTRLYGSDGEATVDGVHATDVGFLRMADVIGTAVDKALAGIGKQ